MDVHNQQVPKKIMCIIASHWVCAFHFLEMETRHKIQICSVSPIKIRQVGSGSLFQTNIKTGNFIISKIDCYCGVPKSLITTDWLIAERAFPLFYSSKAREISNGG